MISKSSTRLSNYPALLRQASFGRRKSLKHTFSRGRCSSSSEIPYKPYIIRQRKLPKRDPFNTMAEYVRCRQWGFGTGEAFVAAVFMKEAGRMEIDRTFPQMKTTLFKRLEMTIGVGADRIQLPAMEDFDQAAIKIGRAWNNHIIADGVHALYKYISRRHASFVIKDGFVFLRDDSKNGSYFWATDHWEKRKYAWEQLRPEENIFCFSDSLLPLNFSYDVEGKVRIVIYPFDSPMLTIRPHLDFPDATDILNINRSSS